MKIDPKDVAVMFGDIVCEGFVDSLVEIFIEPYVVVPYWVPGYVVDLLQLNGVEPSTTVHLFVEGDCIQVSVILAPISYIEVKGSVTL